MGTLKEISGSHAVVGLKWGDESKAGKIDAIYNGGIVARYNGGDNAGHTVTIGKEVFQLHLLPAGILHPDAICCIGNGVVVNPTSLAQEINDVQKRGIDVDPSRLLVDYASQLIMPWHIIRDALQEASSGKMIGTTLKGIGPAYADQALRIGPRMQDLGRDDFEEYFSTLLANQGRIIRAMAGHPNVAIVINQLQEELKLQPQLHKQKMLQLLTRAQSDEPIDRQQFLSDLDIASKVVLPYRQNTVAKVWKEMDDGGNVGFEPGQGLLLDLNLGTNPYQTSSHPGTAGIAISFGADTVRRLVYVLGVAKAFDSRVGGGPMVTEVFDMEAERLRGSGSNPWDEYGVTTGRPRRVGWHDAVAGKYAARIGGATCLAIAKMDILAGIEKVPLCVGYQVGNQFYSEITTMDMSFLKDAKPVYKYFDGWNMPSKPIRQWSDIPEEAKKYLDAIEDAYDKPVKLVSFGSDRDDNILRPY